MAVNSAQLAELRERQNDLRKEIENVYEKIENERKRIESEKLERLIRTSEENLAYREAELHEEYRRLLDAETSEQERILSENLRVLEERYSEVCAEVSAAAAEERKRTEEIMLRQQKFEEAFLMQKELARDTAANSLKEAEKLFVQLSAAPVEWFRRGRLKIYRSQLGEIRRLYDMELYESAAAVGDNMLLSMKLELLECGELFRRWLRYYRMLAGILEDERILIYEKALKVPQELEKFRAAHGNGLDAELADQWTNGGYGKLREAYKSDFSILDSFRKNGGRLITDENELKEFMLNNPDIGAVLRENALYRSVTRVMQSRNDAQKAISSMHDRLSAFDRRLELAGETIDALANETGYSLLDLPPFGDEGEAGTFAMTFADANNVHTVDVMIVPVRRYSDGAWINHAVWFYSDGTGGEALRMLESALANVFVRERRISLRRDVMRVNQTREERVSLARGEMQLMQNLRMS